MLLYQGRWIPLGRLNLLTSAERRPRCWTIRKGRSRTNTVKLGRAGRSGHFLMQWMLCWVTGHRSTYCSDWYTRRSQLQQGRMMIAHFNRKRFLNSYQENQVWWVHQARFHLMTARPLYQSLTLSSLRIIMTFALLSCLLWKSGGWKMKQRGTSWKNNGWGCWSHYEGTRVKWWQVCLVRGKENEVRREVAREWRKAETLKEGFRGKNLFCFPSENECLDGMEPVYTCILYFF